MSGGVFGFIEIIFFYGIAIGFGVWQVWKTDKELKKTRAEREAREAQEAVNATAKALDEERTNGPSITPRAASDKEA